MIEKEIQYKPIINSKHPFVHIIQDGFGRQGFEYRIRFKIIVIVNKIGFNVNRFEPNLNIDIHLKSY